MTTENEEVQEPTPTPPDEAQKTDEKGAIPYERFKQVNDEKKALQDRIAAIEQKEAEAAKKAKADAEKRLAEQAEFEKLAEQRKAELDEAAATSEAQKEQLEAQEQVLTALYEAEKPAVPEMYHELLESLTLVKRLDWIAKNKDKLNTASGGGIPKTPQPKGKGDISDEQRRRQAARAW